MIPIRARYRGLSLPAIDQLGDTLEAMSSAVHRRDVSTVIEVDLGFHRALAALADNKILDKVYHLTAIS